MTTNDPAWAPDACTLPTEDRPLRVAEFDSLVATAVRRISPTHAEVHLAGGDGLAATVRDLTARETECCSFWDFTVTPSNPGVLLDVRVPDLYADVLEALVRRFDR